METYAANLVTENGESYIPASQRPDGSWRKARRVKEGYVPQEEVPLYESKGKQFANKVSKPQTITLPTGQVARQAIPGLFIVDDKEKEQKTKSKKKSSSSSNTDNINKKLAEVKLSEESWKVQSSEKKSKQNKQSNKAQESKENAATVQSQATDPAKRLKNLKKRLREVEALEEKLKSGLIPNPDPDQLKKVERKNDLLLEIRQLEKQV